MLVIPYKKYNWRNTQEIINDLHGLTAYQQVSSVMPFVTTMPQRQRWAKYRREISVHSEGFLFSKIKERRPNEPEEVLTDRLKEYEAATTGAWSEAEEKIMRVILASSADIVCTPNTSEYVALNNFEGLNLWKFFSNKAVRKVIREPNALCVTYPLDYVKDKGLDSPVQFIEEMDIVYLDKNAVIFISREASEYEISYNACENEIITYNTRAEITYRKPTYHIFSGVDFVEAVRSDDSKSWIITTYTHNLGFIPCFQNGGIEQEKYVHRSYFHHAIAFGNMALSHLSDFIATTKRYSFPHVRMLADECEACNGVGHVIAINNENKSKETCVTCKGSGKFVHVSPAKVILKKRQESNAEPNQSDEDDVKFFNPDVAILEHGNNIWREFMRDYKQSLKVIERRETGGAESADSIELQYQPLYDFMNKIGTTLFGNLEKILIALQGYIEPNVPAPSVTQPISYHIIEESKAFDAISKALEKDMPLPLRRQYVRGFISKFIGIKSPVLKHMEILESIDPYLYYTLAERQGLKMSGVINAEQMKISVSGYGVMVQVYNDVRYKEADRDVIGAEILRRISEFKIDEIKIIDNGLPN